MITFFTRATLFCTFFFSSIAIAALPIIPAPPQIAAKAFVLMDAQTGEILVEKNADQILPPASLTKMMTSYIIEEQIMSGQLLLSDEVLISVNAWQTPGSTMYIKEGDKVLVEDLLRGIIIQSGNDASVAMAEHIAGDEDVFAQLMNQYAAKLGMSNTVFNNATGLSEKENFSTARDLAILARAVVYHDPELYKLYSEESFTYGIDIRTGDPINQANRNTLLRDDPSVDGLKTGYTDNAGYCLVASALKNNTRYISVVLGTKSKAARASESKKLLNYGFSFFESVTLIDSVTPLQTARVWKGTSDAINMGLLEPINKNIQKGTKDLHKIELTIDETIIAPIKKGDILGSLNITLEGKIIHTQSVVALEDVEQAGFFARLWDSIKLFFFGLFN